MELKDIGGRFTARDPDAILGAMRRVDDGMSRAARHDPAILNDREAMALADVPFALYAARQAAKLFWALCVKRWPELRGMR